MISRMINFIKDEIAKRTGYPYNIIIRNLSDIIVVKITNTVTNESHEIIYTYEEDFKSNLDKCLGRPYRNQYPSESTTLEISLACSKCRHVFNTKVVVDNRQCIDTDTAHGCITRVPRIHSRITPQVCPQCGRFIESIELSSYGRYLEIIRDN